MQVTWLNEHLHCCTRVHRAQDGMCWRHRAEDGRCVHTMQPQQPNDTMWGPLLPVASCSDQPDSICVPDLEWVEVGRWVFHCSLNPQWISVLSLSQGTASTAICCFQCASGAATALPKPPSVVTCGKNVMAISYRTSCTGPISSQQDLLRFI